MRAFVLFTLQRKLRTSMLLGCSGRPAGCVSGGSTFVFKSMVTEHQTNHIARHPNIMLRNSSIYQFFQANDLSVHSDMNATMRIFCHLL